MAIIEKWNYDVIKKINKESEIPPGRINNKAKAKLKEVVNSFEQTYGESFTLIDIGTCNATFTIDDKKYPMKVKCYYDMKNMLLGRNYDLMLESTIDINSLKKSITGEGFSADSFILNTKFSGKLKSMDVKFGRNKGDGFAVRMADAISDPVISQVIKRLGLINVRVEYKKMDNVLSIYQHSMRGSATWCLIPPIFQLIQLKQEDCLDIINLFQMIMHGMAKTINAQ